MNRQSRPAAVVLLLLPALLAAGKQAQEESDSETTLSRRWTTLILVRDQSATPRDLPADAPLQPVAALQLKGPHPQHPFLLGDYNVDGNWEIRSGGLRRTFGPNALLRLPEAEDFELEGYVESTRLGGWMILLGWTDDNSGYLLYNVTMKTQQSGSPWHLCQVQQGQAVVDTDREVARQDWEGLQPLGISVHDGKVSLTIGRHRILRELPLDGYSRGRVLLGTYDTRYGPKELCVRSLRMRAR